MKRIMAFRVPYWGPAVHGNYQVPAELRGCGSDCSLQLYMEGTC